MFRLKYRKPSSDEIKTTNEVSCVHDVKAIDNIQTVKCTTFFLRYLYYHTEYCYMFQSTTDSHQGASIQ
jgi:hypothetical protein